LPCPVDLIQSTRAIFDILKKPRLLGVILNNDNWLMYKKHFVFMSEKERKEVIEAIRWVDEVVITRHAKNTDDISVTEDLRRIKPDIFANGGDRKAGNIPEYELCQKLGIKMVFNVGQGGKIQSSSELVTKAVKTVPNKIQVQIKKTKN
jgi:glycerol-3-phosphate cytidylyltransferase-like family protein